MSRLKAEQKYIVLLNDGTVLGTKSGGPFTRDGAWLCERFIREVKPNLAPMALKLTPFREGDYDGNNGTNQD